jgi:hypothetical protein
VALIFANGASLMAETVEVEGKAAGDLLHAREEALADALREAVRVGVGVDVLTSTGVKDFQLEFDRILTAAFGHVKSYKVQGSRLGDDGIYRVKVRAEVQAGTPGMSEELALLQIVQLKQSPRVALRISEQIDGVPDGKGYSAAWFEQAAKKYRLQVVDERAISASESARARRDEALGNDQGARLRRSGASQKVDFVIEGKISGKYAGTESLFGSLPEHCFEVGGELKAVRPDTGEVVTSFVVDGTNKYRSGLQTKEMAAREVLFKVLDGKKAKKGESEGGVAFFTKVFARWMVELDCGSVRQLEFERIDAADFAKVQSGLKVTDKVGAVWQREFDAQGVSQLDVETRLTSQDLGAEVTKILGGSIRLDRTTESYLLFKSGGGLTADKVSGVPAEKRAGPTEGDQGKKKGLIDRFLGR